MMLNDWFGSRRCTIQNLTNPDSRLKSADAPVDPVLNPATPYSVEQGAAGFKKCSNRIRP